MATVNHLRPDHVELRLVESHAHRVVDVRLCQLRDNPLRVDLTDALVGAWLHAVDVEGKFVIFGVR